MTVTKHNLPSCIGGLDAESEWCNNECPDCWLSACIDSLIDKIAPENRLELLTQLKFKREINAFADACQKNGKRVAGGKL